MGLFTLFKKKSVPSELPDLAFGSDGATKKDSLEKDTALVGDHLREEEKYRSSVPQVPAPSTILASPPEPSASLPSESTTSTPSTKQTPSLSPSKSFFDQLQQDITGELDNLDRLEDWYQHKFLPQDIVSTMRQYWESQKANSVLAVLGKNFKERIHQKTSELQELEREWQNVYFDLIEKEEEIKEREQDLKLLLSEFVEVCKRKKEQLSEPHNEQKKKTPRKKGTTR